jgi:hypothetical protein
MPVSFLDDQMMQSMAELIGKPFDLILGRSTYEIFAVHRPHTDHRPRRDCRATGRTTRSGDRGVTTSTWNACRGLRGSIQAFLSSCEVTPPAA